MEFREVGERQQHFVENAHRLRHVDPAVAPAGERAEDVARARGSEELVERRLGGSPAQAHGTRQLRGIVAEDVLQQFHLVANRFEPRGGALGEGLVRCHAAVAEQRLDGILTAAHAQHGPAHTVLPGHEHRLHAHVCVSDVRDEYRAGIRSVRIDGRRWPPRSRRDRVRSPGSVAEGELVASSRRVRDDAPLAHPRSQVRVAAACGWHQSDAAAGLSERHRQGVGHWRRAPDATRETEPVRRPVAERDCVPAAYDDSSEPVVSRLLLRERYRDSGRSQLDSR